VEEMVISCLEDAISLQPSVPRIFTTQPTHFCLKIPLSIVHFLNLCCNICPEKRSSLSWISQTLSCFIYFHTMLQC